MLGRVPTLNSNGTQFLLADRDNFFLSKSAAIGLSLLYSDQHDCFCVGVHVCLYVCACGLYQITDVGEWWVLCGSAAAC